MLAIIASQDERYVIAEGLLKKIIKLSGDDYRPYSDLGRFLGERGRIPEAIEMLEKAVALDSTVVSLHLALANFLAILGTPADALRTYDAAMQFDPDYPPALVGRGNMLRILGRREEAIVAYERVIALRPEVGSAWWSLASLKNYRFSTEKVDEMRSYLDSDELDVDSKFSFHFALARVCETGKDFDGAWENYELGNSLKRAKLSYDPVRIEVSHDKIIQLFDREFLELNSGRPTEDGPAPIFIVGMPRSGSTLLEQILASHSQVEGCAELPYVPMLSDALGGARSDGKKYPQVLNELTTDQLVSIGKSYIYHTKTNRPENRPRFTDKMPTNFAHVGFIHLTLPNAKIIDARRHPLDTCLGNYRQLFAQGKNHAYDLNECAEYFLEYIRLMDHWDNVLPGRVLKVQYEDVVDDVEKQTRRMLEYCELPWEDTCLDFYASDRAVNTASAEQVREPIYRDAVGYWKNYESQLADIQEILAPVLSGGT
jgi:tetratricopeptide (TPR) repeat protein